MSVTSFASTPDGRANMRWVTLEQGPSVLVPNQTTRSRWLHAPPTGDLYSSDFLVFAP